MPTTRSPPRSTAPPTVSVGLSLPEPVRPAEIRDGARVPSVGCPGEPQEEGRTLLVRLIQYGCGGWLIVRTRVRRLGFHSVNILSHFNG
jgi:hypothetical protein